ncbi:hypothetical protein CA235_18395 [Sphingomonas sp. ABOLF]|uniref:HIRAN domain-containing protein n=1 Tax=Sphingomonas sp. ABOLF TaxID=1985879 RepID=UPI000F7E1893|nr:HIRAN domain-containing protein [Sphingomonas sp. ABOLF]RSV11641.1 hypothetical protein CA235_18395 [Sphingomonas sp. ABOLF]
MRALSLAVVGADYPNKRGPGRRFELALCSPGELVELRPEPENPKDEYAVAVYSARGVQLGYLTAERAPYIGRMLRQGRDVAAVFQELTAYGGVIRAAFDGERPVLPTSSAAPARQEHDGFWPDPDYSDE